MFQSMAEKKKDAVSGASAPSTAVIGSNPTKTTANTTSSASTGIQSFLSLGTPIKPSNASTTIKPSNGNKKPSGKSFFGQPSTVGKSVANGSQAYKYSAVDDASEIVAVPCKVESNKSNKMSVESIYQKKTQHEHILLRPDTYIGSVEKITTVPTDLDVYENIIYLDKYFKTVLALEELELFCT